MKIAIAQINPTVGDLAGNSQQIAEAARRAHAAGADLVVVSELAISGYPPKDLLLRQGFVEACDRAVANLAQSIPGTVGLLVGHPSRWNLPDDATLRDVVLVVRADEAHHRDVNHSFANELAGLPSRPVAECPPHVALEPIWKKVA